MSLDGVLSLFPEFHDDESCGSNNDRLCRISYSEQYRMAACILSLVMEREETSSRVLSLTEYIVNECEGHYTAWNYRRLCILAQSSMEALKEELEWIERYTRDCPKNYQLWQHRMHIMSAALSASKMEDSGSSTQIVNNELEYSREELDRNPKNYHAWQYRQWLVQTSPQCIDTHSEYEFIMTFIRGDSFNNSAYNHLVFMKRVLPDGFAVTDKLVAYFIENEMGEQNQALQSYLRFAKTK